MARFMRKGTNRWYFVLTIANVNYVPTAAEVNAGTRIDTDLAEVNGFMYSNSPIQVPDMASTFTKQIGGEDSAEDSSLVFYEHSSFAANTIRAALPKNATGFVVIFKGGIAGGTVAAGDRCDVWPVVITSNAAQYTADNEAAKFQVSFSVSDRPAENASVT